MALIRARRSPSAEALVPPAQALIPNTLDRRPRPLLPFTDDGPGTLCSHGPRHDNDKIDYKEIEILPTADEILAVSHPVYMPKKDLCTPNFLPLGPARHRDLLFRQLRYDSTESIRDICYSAAQVAFLGTKNEGAHDQEQIRHETVAGNQYFLYHNVRVEELLAHETKGMLVRISYDCPSFMRGRKMYGSQRFQEGMLAALIQLDHATNEFSVFFFEVTLAQTTFSMDNFKGAGRRAAVQLAFLPCSKYDDVLQLCRHPLGLRQHCELFLVEFPKVLFAGIYTCLKRLQEMGDTDFAFQKYVAPGMPMEEALLAREHNLTTGSPSMIRCPPPTYATSPAFTYNMSKLVPSTSQIASLSLQELSDELMLHRLKQETMLDDGQATALRDCLMREFALTQGPPGCGKTFLGVQLAKTLLESRPNLKPLLLVCLTNHALDSFLADLRDAGVKNLLRIGSGSKQEWTTTINIQTSRRKARLPREDSMTMATFTKRKKETFAAMDALCKALSSQYHTGDVSWQYVQENLSNHYPEIYAQLSTNASSSHAKAFTFEYWSGGGDLENIRNLHVELASRLAEKPVNYDQSASNEIQDILLDISYYAELQSSKAGAGSIWNMSLQRRQQLLQTWEAEVNREEFAVKMADLHFELQQCSQDSKGIHDARDVKIMAAHNIIGMTTTACAARWELLRSLAVEILICEEAAEVMEAHTLCSLLPTLQHAVFIGDPQQLRPEANEQRLSIEDHVGADYRLDESLLERLMLPRDPSASAIPTSHLNIQRRMHPEIANLARLTYPYLKDHMSTHNRVPSYGVEHRMFWWDHRMPELESNELKSHINVHEVEMVAGLVEYLLRDGAYSQGEIAILTPYSGQLAKLHERLSITCNIWLSDKDREVLLAEELLALGEEGRTTKDEVAVSDMLRVSTVDNFQGEEAKIIILSTVRSGGRAGFLKTANRAHLSSPVVMLILNIAMLYKRLQTSRTLQSVQQFVVKHLTVATNVERDVIRRHSIRA
ncbi:hypothetical protein A1O1_04596 [Capronia coronata CBS 617.96]|uniref:DNA2/NAM7 helicase-like C-terminal domain-containing protein n=1 Tax=Capronia coronata CBS 617.96 TaxID=1182541 RepID=W9Y4C1_9EURO|nr:uncharacterized protein A1O1_04596 [Capronia coronata CBS 617.96]EXJ87672.1 hypothetical protein A1O1_04596 [Capronia coronata CBS 617.96]